MAGVIDELLVGLGFDYDPEDLEQFNDDIDAVTSTIKAFAKVIAGATVALVGFTSATTAATDRQGKLSKQTGVSVEEIDALEFALKRAGGQGDAMATSLEQLSIRISETSRGTGSGVEAFGILGVSVTDVNGKLKNTDSVLLEVSDRLQRFSKAEQIELADKLGLRDSILLLQEGSAGIRQLTDDARALGVTTKEDSLLSEEFQDSLTDIFQVVKQFSRVLTRSLVPIMQDVATSFTDWWKANRQLIEQNIPKIIDKVTFAFKLLTLAAVGFLSVKLISALSTMITLFSALGVRALLANLAIAALPIILGAIAAAFVLLVEDAKVFFEGGESFIGSMLEKYPQWADEIRVISAALATVAKLTGMVFDGWGEIFDLFKANDPIADLLLAIRTLDKSVRVAFGKISGDIKKLFNDIWTDISNSFDENVITPIRDKLKELKAFFGFEDEEINVKIKTEGEPDIDLSNIVLGQDNIEREAGTGRIVNIPEGFDLSNVVFGDFGESIPELQELSVAFEDLPELANIQTDDAEILNRFSVDQSANQNQLAGISSSDVTNTTNTSDVKIDLGGIKVDVKTSSNVDPQTSGKQIGESIRRELEPILKQASRNLNSGVLI